MRIDYVRGGYFFDDARGKADKALTVEPEKKLVEDDGIDNKGSWNAPCRGVELSVEGLEERRRGCE